MLCHYARRAGAVGLRRKFQRYTTWGLLLWSLGRLDLRPGHMLFFYLSFLACLFVMGRVVVDWASVLATDCAVAGDPCPMH